VCSGIQQVRGIKPSTGGKAGRPLLPLASSSADGTPARIPLESFSGLVSLSPFTAGGAANFNNVREGTGKGEMGLFPVFLFSPSAQFPFSPILEQRLIADLEESLVPCR
jgi:hypothetical protein